MVFIWSGQHYSDNLKSIFFRELDIAPAELDLGCGGATRTPRSWPRSCRSCIRCWRSFSPWPPCFSATRTRRPGALAAAQLNIPVVHIEGCMRSYDWRMPEEKYRTTIDHLADVIYTYFDEYKEQGVREGLNPANIVVVGNPIVDILNHYYYSRKAKFDAMATPEFFATRGLERGKYYLMTCHRRENVHIPTSLAAIFDLVGQAPHPVYFPASYRTQKVMKETGSERPADTRDGRSDRLRRDAVPDGQLSRRRSPTRGQSWRKPACCRFHRCRCASRPSVRRSTMSARA